MMVKITTDMIVGALLCLALIVDIALGGPTEVATNLSAGLVGYLGRSIVDNRTGGATK